MMYVKSMANVSALAAFAMVFGASSAHAAPTTQPCESLATYALPNGTITSATLVGAGQFRMPQSPMPPPPPGHGKGPPGPRGPFAASWNPANPAADITNLPAFCRIEAVLKPSMDSVIRIEVWLPQSTWNGKFLGVGSGGLAGIINYTGIPIGLTDALRMGYASATTDDGHDATKDKDPGSFLLHHPEKLIDYGHRANHEMTLKAKALILAFYGKAQSHAYFIGCSMGSLEAINEAARYPEDYDGVIAGALMNPIAHFNAAQLWPTWLISKDPEKAVTAAQVDMVHRAALQHCATPVGMHDGDIENPATCQFDPAILLCRDGATANCLSAKQVTFMQQVYRGPVNPRTGALIFPGPAPGAEGEIAGGLGEPHSASLALYRFGVMQNPEWDWRTLDFDTDIAKADRILGPQMQVGANLNPFLDRGGKLFLFIGWEDYHNPSQVVDYYKSVLNNAGPTKSNSVRLFLVPGMGHCTGGEGCDSFDKVSALDTWVVSGRAPQQLLSTKLDPLTGHVLRSRPLCAYPQIAEYRKGDIDLAQSFSCVQPQ